MKQRVIYQFIPSRLLLADADTENLMSRGQYGRRALNSITVSAIGMQESCRAKLLCSADSVLFSQGDPIKCAVLVCLFDALVVYSHALFDTPLHCTFVLVAL